jgi:hypothetical protein
MRKSRLYIVVHLHKTAGTTFLRNLRANFEEDECLRVYAEPAGLTLEEDALDQGWDRAKIEQYVAACASSKVRLVYGHMVYSGIHEHFIPDRVPFYMTFLRDPVERVISLYAYHRQFGGVWHRELAAHAWSLEEWLERSTMLWRSDGQLRQLLWHAHGEVLREGEVTRAHLEEGKRLLERFAFVGTTETFEQDAAYLYGKLGLRRFHDERVVNATPEKENVSSGVRRLIADRNRLDIELYEFAKAQRERFIRSHRLDFWWQVKKTTVRRAVADLRRRTPPLAQPPTEATPEATAAPPQRRVIRLDDLPAADAGDVEQVVVAQRRRFVVPVRQPLMLVSGLEDGDGPLLARLLDGHTGLHVHPFELEISNPIGAWPVIEPELRPQKVFNRLRQRPVLEHTPLGYRKLKRHEVDRRSGQTEFDLPFMFVESLQKRLFIALLEQEAPASPRDVLDSYATSYFNAWLDYGGLNREARFWVASIPRVLADAGNAARFFADYPDGRLAVPVRDPVEWSTSVSGRDAYPDETAATDLWLECNRNALAAFEAFPGRVLFVKFEDLVEQPEAAVRAVLDPLGLEVEPANLKPSFNGIPVLSGSRDEPDRSLRDQPHIGPDLVTAIRARTAETYARLLNEAERPRSGVRRILSNGHDPGTGRLRRTRSRSEGAG